MATVKVKFRPSTTVEKEGSIYYQIIHARRPRQITTEYKVLTREWDPRRSTVSCYSTSARMPYILYVREHIKADLDRLCRIIKTFESRTSEYTSEDIVDEYGRVVEENSLYRYMNGIIAKMKSNGKIRTAESYRATLNSFRNFLDGSDIMIESMTRDVMESYEAWLRHRGISPNTISFYMRVLRAVYNRGVEDGLTNDKTPFRKVYTGIEKTVKRALPINLIKKIKKLDLTFAPAIEYARDMFILSFMLRGMSLIDMAFLRKSDLKDGYVRYRRRKTGQLLIIQWTKDMQKIVDKYPVPASDYLLPIIRNPKSVSYYAYRNACFTINRHLRQIARRLELSIPLTMYVARHSWASAAKSKGIPISVISEGMGHDSELTTQIYLASLDTTLVDRANSVLLKELR